MYFFMFMICIRIAGLKHKPFMANYMEIRSCKIILIAYLIQGCTEADVSIS